MTDHKTARSAPHTTKPAIGNGRAAAALQKGLQRVEAFARYVDQHPEEVEAGSGGISARTLDLSRVGVVAQQSDNFFDSVFGGTFASRKLQSVVRCMSISYNPQLALSGAQSLFAHHLPANAPLLTSLDLFDIGLDDEGVINLVAFLARGAEHLKKLKIGENRLTHVGAQRIAAAFPKASQLTQLQMGSNAIGDIGATELLNAASHAPNLTSLGLRDCGLTEQSAEAIAFALVGGCPHLVELRLKDNAIGDATLEAIGRRLLSLQSRHHHHTASLMTEAAALQTVELRNTSISSAGVQALFAALAQTKFPFVSPSYDFSENPKIDDRGAAAVAAFYDATWKPSASSTLLTIAESLTSLDFSGCSIGAAGAKSLARCVANGVGGGTANQQQQQQRPASFTLTTLSLSRNPLKEGATALAEAIVLQRRALQAAATSSSFTPAEPAAALPQPQDATPPPQKKGALFSYADAVRGDNKTLAAAATRQFQAAEDNGADSDDEEHDAAATMTGFGVSKNFGEGSTTPQRRTNRGLVALELSSCQIPNSAFVCLIRSLYCDDCHAASAFCASLPTSGLKTLDLSQNFAGADGGAAVIAMLKACGCPATVTSPRTARLSLTHLLIPDNEIPESVMAQLPAALYSELPQAAEIDWPSSQSTASSEGVPPAPPASIDYDGEIDSTAERTPVAAYSGVATFGCLSLRQFIFGGQAVSRPVHNQVSENTQVAIKLAMEKTRKASAELRQSRQRRRQQQRQQQKVEAAAEANANDQWLFRGVTANPNAALPAPLAAVGKHQHVLLPIGEDLFKQPSSADSFHFDGSSLPPQTAWDTPLRSPASAALSHTCSALRHQSSDDDEASSVSSSSFAKHNGASQWGAVASQPFCFSAAEPNLYASPFTLPALTF